MPAAEDTDASRPSRNPPWTRDELILALDFYIRHRDPIPGKGSAAIAKLREEINAVAVSLGLTGNETLRNIDGVYMKLMNFRAHDPAYTDRGGKGLQRGNKDEPVVWDLFAHDPAKLRAVAAGIRANLSSGQDTLDPLPPPEIDDGFEEAEEGKLATRVHRTRERNRKLVRRKKEAFVKAHGSLYCEACAFDFEQVYGQRGSGFIECHHTKPVHTLMDGETTKLADLVVLCANCHRMVHARRPWLTMDELREILAQNGGRRP